MTNQNLVRVEQARHTRLGGSHNWKIVDATGPKVFTRTLIYTTFFAAVANAHRIARREPISTWGLIGVHTDRRKVW